MHIRLHRRGWLATALLSIGCLTACDDSTSATGEPDQGQGGSGGRDIMLDAEPGGAGGEGGMGGAGGMAEGGAGGMMAGGAGGMAPMPDAGIQPGLRLTPESIRLEIGNVPPTAQFTLEDVDEEGVATAIDGNEAEWLLNPTTLGTIDENGLFTSNNQLGMGRVEARLDGVSAFATVEIAGSADIVAEGTDPNAPERFAEAPRDGECSPPVLLYPEPFTVFPRTITGVEFQWDTNGHDLFMLSFEAGNSSVRYYTNQNAYTPAEGSWASLLQQAAVGQPLRLTIYGLGGDGPIACATATNAFTVDTSSLQGAIYYWSTADSGIMRLAPGDEAEAFLNPQTAPQINCPACHALSRDGSRIAFTRTSFPPFGDMATSLVDAPADMLYDPTGIAGYFPSWAPDNVQIVAGSNGQLLIRNADTGAQMDQLPLPASTVGGSPDWSWQGDRIVAAIGPSGLANPLPDAGINSADIYRWQLVDGMWQMPELLVQKPAERWLDRPAFSPDGDWVVYNSIGSDPNPDDDMGNPNSELWFIDSTGGAPIPLSRANQGALLGNSWPKWAPDDGRGRLWVAFSSTRNYGHRLENDQRQFANPQIWITAIDPEAAARGEDPSSPAFWLPGQSLESGNHIPYWAVYEKE
ncbi:MAG: hypothetical protein ACE366_08625 [Bradymonadia bacterium]